VWSPPDLSKVSDKRALDALRRTNYQLCKQFLRRRFSNKPLEERFHWIAFFQGQRDAGTRHLHVLFYVPAAQRPKTPFENLKMQSAIQAAWLQAREGARPVFPWIRTIQGESDNASVATYVSRYCLPVEWNNCGDVHFSQ
jgi:hypothetical protein